MTNRLLDTVEPTLWGHKALDTLIISNTPHAHLENVALYSRETVESLLAECRKQARMEALLEAAEVCDGLQSINYCVDVRYAADKLRRMEEGERE